jgi:hypothetical protein
MVQVEGTRAGGQEASNRNTATRFELTAWYAPEVKRYVRVENRLWSAGSALLSEERIDLLEASGN